MKKLIGILIACCFAGFIFSCGIFEKKLMMRQEAKIAVMNFKTPQSLDTFKEIKGYLFTSRDLYRIPEMGSYYADYLAKELSAVENVTVYPRPDLKYIIANKRSILEEQYPDLREGDVDELIAELPPQKIADEIGVDYIITGSIIEHYTSHNRIIHTWKSYLKVKIIIMNAKTGSEVFSDTISASGFLSSEKIVVEKNSRKAARKIIQQINK